jgi:hypothetical protein
VEPSFYCRSCQLTTLGRWIPAGCYVLERAVGGGGRHLRVGLYCSLGCLTAADDGLAAAERDAGTQRGLPAGVERDRARLMEIAQTLLHPLARSRVQSRLVTLTITDLLAFATRTSRDPARRSTRLACISDRCCGSLVSWPRRQECRAG